MFSNTKKQVRNGRSLSISHDNITQKQLIEFGLSAESAKRAINVRRVLPYVEDPTTPCIDAEKLWSRIGKPYKRFRAWAEHYIKPLIDDHTLNAEICAFEDSTKAGKPSKGYTISRNLAVHLAMQAKTPQGWEIRCYFIDMESIVFRLTEYNLSRAVVPVKLDNRLTHATYKQNPKRAVVIDIKFKSYLCKALTGMSAGEIHDTYGERIRDILKSRIEQMDVYNEAYTMAVAMYESGKKWREIEPLIKHIYGGKIDLEKLIRTQ